MRALIFLVLLGCGSNAPNVFDPQDSDVAERFADAEEDTTIFKLDGGYVACVKITTQPTSYPRLLERDCVDSNDVVYMKDYLDTQLNIGCRWKIASDVIRCLPENEQSAPFYADNVCSQMVALVEVDSTFHPVEPYIGLDHYLDGGNYIDIYDQNGSFSGGIMYHWESLSEWVCNPLFFHIPGTKPYYVGKMVDPKLFVPQ